MEVMLKRPHDNSKESVIEVNGGCGETDERFLKASPTGVGEKSSATSSNKTFSNSKNSTAISKEDQIESTKAEMGEVKEENQRLKTLLSQIMKDYQSLQMHFFDIVKQENHNFDKRSIEELTPIYHEKEEAELVSLRLGTNSLFAGHTKLEENIMDTIYKSKERSEEGLNLGLDCKFEGYNDKSSDNKGCKDKEEVSNPSCDGSFEEVSKEGKAGEVCSARLKNLSPGDHDEILHQVQAKKARVSVRVRCQTPTMNDGCQWRKYGQKIAKGNPCPRAYYRCTVAPACPVRKQVQRCAEDMSILITTYEGNHNHPLPMSATAMASTTSAAASMLMAGSSTSLSGNPATVSGAQSEYSGHHSLNFSIPNSSRTIPPFYFPNTTISPSPSYSTITLDLTLPPSQTSQFNRLSSNSSFSISMPSSWNGRNYIACGANDQFNKASYSQESLGQSFMHNSNQAMSSNCLTDSIAKALTSDPSFQSALQAAITSYVGASGGQNKALNHYGHDYGGTSSVPSSLSAKKGGFTVLQSPLTPLSNAKIGSTASPMDISWENMK